MATLAGFGNWVPCNAGWIRSAALVAPLVRISSSASGSALHHFTGSFGGVQANRGRGVQPVDPRFQFGPE
ncbi:hypothetical protein H7H82_14210 [Mycobacterium heidelbergense]|uniref:hypothetical protein n=1 Tax=Mycobacterium heidelbergense TaxID=53376 RepID=UPI001301B035|nr:hypothetical protein [Mycobacterium heidelbergense]MCV7051733.1 hypothetical protein [Mycobacterium heidelbergense]BBZ50280.1 hypothetical protein MHEI_19970 [Mycobacterium heidelbergense]